MAFIRCTGQGGAPTPVVLEPYIYNVGDVGFNSGHKHTANTKVRMKAVFDTWYGYGQAFGARNNSKDYNAMGFFAWYDGYRIAYMRTGQEVTGQYFDQAEINSSMWYGQPVILECEGQDASWYVDGFPSVIHSVKANSSNVDAGIAPLGIFCCNNTTTPDGWNAWDAAKYMCLYWLEIYESDELVHRFVPAFNNNQYCLYDEIEQEYIYECNNNYARLRGSSNIPTT